MPQFTVAVLSFKLLKVLGSLLLRCPYKEVWATTTAPYLAFIKWVNPGLFLFIFVLFSLQFQ